MSVRNALENYYLPDRVFRRRWLVPMALIVPVTAYVTIDVLASARQMGVNANAWDVVVRVLNDRLWVQHGLTNLLIYLLGDVALLGEMTPYVLPRTKSRWKWFEILAICPIITVAAYVTLLVVILFGVTVTVTPWTLSWSLAAAPLVGRQGLPANFLLTLAPLPTAVFMLTLLGLTWVGIGIVVTIVATATQNAMSGLIAGLALNYSTLIVWLANIHSPLLDSIGFHQRMFLWGNELEAVASSSLMLQALLYWFVWIAVGLTVLWKVCRNLDVLAKDASS